MDINKLYFAEALNKIMSEKKQARIMQKDIAQKAGIHVVTLSKYQNGKQQPSFEHAKRLADALGVSLSVLTGHQEPGASLAVPPQPISDHTPAGGSPNPAHLAQMVEEQKIRISDLEKEVYGKTQRLEERMERLNDLKAQIDRHQTDIAAALARCAEAQKKSGLGSAPVVDRAGEKT